MRCGVPATIQPPHGPPIHPLTPFVLILLREACVAATRNPTFSVGGSYAAREASSGG